MKETLYIMGHKNPDSDSICSALAYAEYKNGSGNVNAIPVRLGDINRESKFILDYFEVEPPALLETVRLSVEDLDFDRTAPVSSDISLRMALEIIKKKDLDSLLITDENGQLKGIATISDIIQSYIEVWDNNFLGKFGTSIDNIIETLSGKIILNPKEKPSLTGKISIFAMDPKSAGDYIEENDIIICGDRRDAQGLALSKNISLLIVSGNIKVHEEIIKSGKKKGTAIISTPHDTFTTARLITQAMPIKDVMTTDNLVKFNSGDLVDDIKEKMSQTRYRSYPVIGDNNKLMGSISRYHLISSAKKKVILVDHNERSQSVDGLEESEILEIIDHHRVADVFTGNPIYFRNEPVGSTATIIGSIFFENGRRPSKKMAGILSAAIISDTLLLKSPTSTNTDRIMLERLARIANLEIGSFAMEMFKAGTSLEGKQPEELLKQDFKIFTIEDDKVGLAQVFTMDPDSLEDMKADLVSLMKERAREENYSIFILMLTDIFNRASEMIVVGRKKELVAKAFEKELINNSFYVADVLSRKKQVVPLIADAIINE